MPAPTKPRTRRYLKRDELLEVLADSATPNLTQLADKLNVHRVVMSRIANGHDPISPALERELRAALGVRQRDDVAWIETR